MSASAASGLVAGQNMYRRAPQQRREAHSTAEPGQQHVMTAKSNHSSGLHPAHLQWVHLQQVVGVVQGGLLIIKGREAHALEVTPGAGVSDMCAQHIQGTSSTVSSTRTLES